MATPVPAKHTMTAQCPSRAVLILPRLSDAVRLPPSAGAHESAGLPPHAADIVHGKLRPLTIEHIPYVFAGAEKKK